MAKSLTLRQYVDAKLKALEDDRKSFWTHWRELATYVLPRRYRWLVTPNEMRRGSPINQSILDSTGTLAVRTLAAGMMAGITSPTRPWFKLRIAGWSNDESDPVSIWLAEVEQRMLRVFAESNFYSSMATVYLDLAVFGTACQIEYEDFDDVVRFYNPALGEFYYANDSKGRVRTVAREMTMTIDQVVAEFGEDNVSDETKSAYERGGSECLREIVVCHLIEENSDKFKSEFPRRFQFREMYWEKGSPHKDRQGNEAKWLRKKGYNEWPVQTPRWDLTSNDAYGRSPCMDALPDIKQLQQETKRKGQALDKMVAPPMLADAQLKNQPMSFLPGGVTFVNRLENGTGARPIYQVAPPVAELMQDISEVQQRVRNTLFNDLFLMISQLETVRTATEIDARREEKMIMLGPVLERFENEALDPTVNRTFNIMLRNGMLPPPPPEIEGREIQVQYVSILADNQRAIGLTGIERLLAMAGNLAAVRPDVLDNVNFDEAITEYGMRLDVPPKLLFDSANVAKQREQKAKQVQAAQAQQEAGAMVQGAKVLSETDVGGGQNALQSMLVGGAAV